MLPYRMIFLRTQGEKVSMRQDNVPIFIQFHRISFLIRIFFWVETQKIFLLPVVTHVFCVIERTLRMHILLVFPNRLPSGLKAVVHFPRTDSNINHYLHRYNTASRRL